MGPQVAGLSPKSHAVHRVEKSHGLFIWVLLEFGVNFKGK